MMRTSSNLNYKIIVLHHDTKLAHKVLTKFEDIAISRGGLVATNSFRLTTSAVFSSTDFSLDICTLINAYVSPDLVLETRVPSETSDIRIGSHLYYTSNEPTRMTYTTSYAPLNRNDALRFVANRFETLHANCILHIFDSENNIECSQIIQFWNRLLTATFDDVLQMNVVMTESTQSKRQHVSRQNGLESSGESLIPFGSMSSRELRGNRGGDECYVVHNTMCHVSSEYSVEVLLRSVASSVRLSRAAGKFGRHKKLRLLLKVGREINWILKSWEKGENDDFEKNDDDDIVQQRVRRLYDAITSKWAQLPPKLTHK